MIKLSPSMLSSNYAAMGADAKRMEMAGADYLHLDVMDGSFVPKISFGSDIIRALRGQTDLPFDVHLMNVEPDKHLQGLPAPAQTSLPSMRKHAGICSARYARSKRWGSKRAWRSIRQRRWNRFAGCWRIST
jgi:ribulose-phosphate 3-epimerase